MRYVPGEIMRREKATRGFRKDLVRGTTRLNIYTHDNTYSQSDSVSGTLTVITGDQELCGTGIVIQLIEYWDETVRTRSGWTRSTCVRVIDSKNLSGPFRFLPSTICDMDFDLKLPANCRITDREGGWYIGVDLMIPGVEDPMEFIDIVVCPAEEFLAIIDTMEEDMKFNEKTRSRTWDKDTGRTRFRLFPPHALRCEFDLVEFEMELMSDGSVQGEIMFDLQENSFRDYIRLIKGRDRVKRFFELPCDLVLGSDGKRNSTAIMDEILKKMKYVIKSEDVEC
jgi:hypothetical protein